jgi:hypothetical protein
VFLRNRRRTEFFAAGISRQIIRRLMVPQHLSAV